MGSANRALWKSLGIATSRTSLVNSIPHPSDQSKQLYFFADVAHLIKNLRSMLCNHKQIVLDPTIVQKYNLPSNIVNVSHLMSLVDYQEGKHLLLAPKLTKSLLTPGHFNSMKVGQALNVFSHSVSCGLNEMVDQMNYPAELKTTAWFVEQCNHWFDLMCSRSPTMALSKRNVTKYEEAVQFLMDFDMLIATSTFGDKTQWKPIQSGIALSTKSVIDLSEEVLEHIVSFLLTSRLTQDCLESLFGCIRMKNPVPTPLEFKNALKLIAVGQFLNESKMGSYLRDDNDYLSEFLSVPVPSEEEDIEEVHKVVICSFTSDSSPPQDELPALYYLVGYCVHSMKKKKQLCDTCLSSALLSSDDALPSDASFTIRKEYKLEALTRCSLDIFNICKNIELIVRHIEPIIKTLSNPHKIILDNCLQCPAITSIVLPSCHNMKAKLLDRFISVRLQLLCKKMRQATATRRSGTAMGSRSMAMHEWARTV